MDGYRRTGSNLVYGSFFLAGLVADEAELRQGNSSFSSGQGAGGKHRNGIEVAGALVACLLLTIFSGVTLADEPVYDLDIPAMNAAEALNRFAEQTGAIMLFPYDLASARRANAVTGRYTLLEGLDVLLLGTGLSGGLSDKRVVSISPAENEQRLEEDEAMIGQEVPLGRKIAAFVASIFTASAASGQDVDAEGESYLEVLEEIVVTAQKREERLIEVPLSMSVLSADYLDKINALRFGDFANTVPGLSFRTTGAGGTQISLRGVTMGTDVSPTVGIYVDEVPYGSSTFFGMSVRNTLDVALFDLDRIEVLRGPQGTLYGASTMGGLLKYVTKQPDTTRFGVDVRTGISNVYDGGVSYHGAVTVNAPFAADKAALRATGYYSRNGGYIDNLDLDETNVNLSDIYGGRADLLLTPTETLSIRIAGFMQNISREGLANADYALSGVPLDGSLEQRRLFAEPFDQRFRLVSGTVTYDLDWASLKSISSYQTLQSPAFLDFSRLLGPVLASIGHPFSVIGSELTTTTDKFTQEVRLASKATDAFEWVIGGFYTHETSEVHQVLILRDLAGQPAPNDIFTLSSPSRYEEYAAFGGLTWHLTSKFDMTGGIRYARNEQKVTQFGSGLLGSSKPTTRSTEDVFTYLANMRYYFTDHATGYLRYATGYRPGGPNFFPIDPATGLPSGPETFEADRLKSYEVGLKAETTDRRLGVDVAVYNIDWSNIQIDVVRNGFSVNENAPGGARVRGAELALETRPTRAFAVTAAFAYQDAEMLEANPDLGAAKGERLPNVPRFTAALNADYELPVGTLEPSIGVTLRYVDDRKARFDSSPLQYRLPDYTTVDLRAGLTLGTVDAQLYVRNLFDERGQLSAVTSAGRAGVTILQPRTIGINVTTSF